MAKDKVSDITVGHTYNAPKKLPDPPRDPAMERRWVTEQNFNSRKWSGWEPVEKTKDNVVESYGNRLVEMPKERYLNNQKAKQERIDVMTGKGTPNPQGLKGVGTEAGEVVVRDGKTIIKSED